SRFTDFSGKDVMVVSLDFAWSLLAPDGMELWQGHETGTFDPSRSKYVQVGSRRSTFGPQGGSEQFQLDFGGKNPETAQIEKIVEQQMLYRTALPAGLPMCIAKTPGGLTPLPLLEKLDGDKP